jgi:hypothetical protein
MPDERIRETNKSVARQVIEAWNAQGETHLPNDLVSPQMVRHYPRMASFAALNGGERPADPALPRDAFRDQRYTEQMLIADDHHVFVAWELTAEHAGTFHGKSATNKRVTVYGSDVIRVADGKIIRHWEYYPKARMAALAQLGLLDTGVQRRMIRDGMLGRNRVIGQQRLR